MRGLSATGSRPQLVTRLALVAALVLLLAACSATQLAYRNADWLIDEWADDYIDFDPVQRERWQRDLAAALEAHRRVELPRVVGLLEAVEAAAREGVDEATLRCLARTGEDLVRRHGRIAAGLAAPLLAGLDGRQVDRLEEAMAQSNAEFREKYLAENLRERRADRIDRVSERITRWTGPLAPAQRAMVVRTVVAAPDLAEPWLAYRKDRQARLLELLREGADAAAVEEFLTAWWVETADRPPALVAATERTRDRYVRLLVRLFDTMEREQRTRVAANVRDVRLDLAELVRAPDPVLAGACGVPRAAAG